MRCPTCGNVIPEYANGVCYRCMEYERKHGGRAMKRVHVPGVRGGAAATTPASKAVTASQRHPSSVRGSQRDDYQRLGIGRLVHAIWGQDMRLSTLLQRNGLSDADIQILKGRLNHLYPALGEAWSLWIHGVMPAPVANLLDCRYSLRGEPPASLFELQQRYDEPYQSLAQLEQHALTYLCQCVVRRQLTAIAIEVGRRIL